MRSIGSLVVVLFISLSSFAQDSNKIDLERGFQNPPNEAKARTWWHWISGNVSKKGITADLEAMKKVGIQEAQLFNVQLEFPKGPVKYMSPEWLDLFHFSAKEAHRLGLELTFHNSAGWSSTGGPWMTPEHAMQTVVYSELIIEGNQKLKKQLVQPETKLNYYKDIAVLAFPKPKADSKIDGLDYKNLSGRIRNHLLPDLKEISNDGVVRKQDIIDLTSKITKDGFLEWNVPKGEWVVLRLGHTPKGKNNHPAPAGGVGLECDKMSKKAVDEFWKGGIQPIINKLGDLIGTTVNNCLIDSYEVGTTNWTTGFDVEFQKLRGYNLTSYLPTLAGYYVDSGEISERFLWDFRRTIGDLMAENYYAYFGELCHKNKMKFSVEPYWGPFDNMQVGATGDIVMCEFWSGGYPFFDSPKFVSSIAHLNGNAIVGAESFTGIGGWDEHPAVLKSIGDRAWAQGINRFIFHTYVHQPWDVAPGLALSYHGADFNRLNTWWMQSKSYMDYIARSQFLLQQGKSVSDVLVFTGESSPNDAFLFPEIKDLGFDYDLIGSNKLNDLFVKDGKLYTPHSGPYEVLVLTNSEWMKPETLQKIEELTTAGAKVIGTQPLKSPSLEKYPKSDDDVKKLAQNLWKYGKVKSISIADFLKKSNLPADFIIEKGDATDVNFLHRKTSDTDIYFVANARKMNVDLLVKFRVSGKQPELWNAETGKRIQLAVWNSNLDGTTSIPLSLGNEEAIFIIFKQPLTTKNHFVNASWELEKQAAEPLSNLKIVKAEYGTFLQEGIEDITERVNNELKNNQLDFNASTKFCECDPAMGYVKLFRMEYQIGDKMMQIEASEKERVFINGGNQQLKVIRALFGKFKPETKGVPKYEPVYDVTGEINKKIALGLLNIPVNDLLLKIEDRTAIAKNAALKINFTTDGEERSETISHGQILKLTKEIQQPTIFVHQGKTTLVTPLAGGFLIRNSLGVSEVVKIKSVPKPIELTGSWDVDFSSNYGNPISTTFDKLTSWSSSSDKEIKYFSGTATYKKQFSLPRRMLKKRYSFDLDLGSVAVIAEVIVNGKNIGTLWKAPFRINMDGFLKKGTNTLEVRVTNLWPNRLIGDEQYQLDIERNGNMTASLPKWLLNPAKRSTERVTFPSYKHWNSDSALLTSGLLGPVRINVSKIQKLK